MMNLVLMIPFFEIVQEEIRNQMAMKKKRMDEKLLRAKSVKASRARNNDVTDEDGDCLPDSDKDEEDEEDNAMRRKRLMMKNRKRHKFL